MLEMSRYCNCQPIGEVGPFQLVYSPLFYVSHVIYKTMASSLVIGSHSARKQYHADLTPWPALPANGQDAKLW